VLHWVALFGVPVKVKGMTRRIVNLLMMFVVTLLISLLVGVVWLAQLQARALVQYDDFRTYPQATPGDVGITDYREVTLTTSDGLALRAWYVPPPGDTPGPALIFTHGISSNRAHWLTELPLLYDAGYGGILFSFRNHGESEGDITTMGLLEVRDVRAALDYLLDQPQVDPERIAIAGDSLGGATALMAAAEMPEIRAVVASSPYSSLLDVVGDRARTDFRLPARPTADLVLFFTNRLSGEDLYTVDPLAAAQQVAPRPMWIIHGELDRTTPVSSTERIVAALGGADAPNLDVWIVPGVGHSDFRYYNNGPFQARLLDFLDTALAPQG
jgi:dipeptidyl aminopeptidase/acylaminoacyl peptidase